MEPNYFSIDKSVTLDPSDLEIISYHLKRIEEASNAYSSISKTLMFLQKEPVKVSKSTKSPLTHNDQIDQILYNVMGDFMEHRGATTRGLISAIDIIADYIEIQRGDIAVTIEAAIREESEERSLQQPTTEK